MEGLCGGRTEGERRAALWFGRRQGRLSLGQLGTLVGMDYAAVGQAVSRFGKRLMKEAKWSRRLNPRLSNVEM